MERALLVVGAGLLAVYVGARSEGAIFSQLAIQSFEAFGKSNPAANPFRRAPASFQTNFSLWSAQRIEAYKLTLAQQFPAPLAVLRIKTLQLEVPLLDGTDSFALNRGVGWIEGTARPDEQGNIGIAGHRDGFFRGLKDLKLGDTADLTTRERTYSFVVDKIEIVSPGDVAVLRSGGSRSLTLVTCYPFYFVGSAPQRYIVHASILNSGPPGTTALGGSSERNVSRQGEQQ